MPTRAVAAAPVSQRARRAAKLAASAEPIEWLTLEEAATAIKTPVPTLREWIRKGRLKAYRPGRNVLVSRSDADAAVIGAPIGGGHG